MITAAPLGQGSRELGELGCVRIEEKRRHISPFMPFGTLKKFFNLAQLIFTIHEFPICRFAYWLKFICNTNINTHVLYWSLAVVQWVVQILVDPTSPFPADTLPSVSALI